MARMIPAFKSFVGGPIGSGRQWFPWIHLQDLSAAVLFLLEHPEISGPVNLCAPDPVTNRDLATALGRVLNRPACMPAPAFMVRMALGEFANVLLGSQRAVPRNCCSIILVSDIRISIPLCTPLCTTKPHGIKGAAGRQESARMTFDDMDEAARQFLNCLFEQTEGQCSRQVSMYDVGAALGWDRDAASRAAQDLMAAGHVEIRTLSGGIGISAGGAAMVQSALGSENRGAAMARLMSSRTMDPAACRSVERVCDDIKAQAGSLGLDFDTSAELMADLKTVADQLGSSRPKTAIVREGLRSLEGVLKQFAGTEAWPVSEP